ncbi:glycerophosphodiester phosphodiesterase family protein [Bifidobacterium sp.]|uniref:glycerophosphodiester phosphodiesterase family protein n=1 Tax=Bifidobacterium sp. TaxID=41200 RepID=UPI0025C7106F|nr:glycerophosphodiester phosphodiesterase family protein [Bifidobacterium sp.]MCH4209099.1 glycerophosphodiester phosphodiesterase [Bifidobacterium sp.]MCI1224720.1 glycerophosphodiester phosphodiesterase [Bifidobacterium sp.]
MAFNGFLKRMLAGGAIAAGAAGWAVAPRSSSERRSLGVPAVPDVLYAHRGLHDAGSGLTEQYAAHSGEYVALARRMALTSGYGTADFSGPIAPENSMAAFAAACEAGYGIELDIQLTADDQVVVVHDPNLRRVAGDPRRIADLTYAQLSRIALFPAPAKPGDAEAIAPPNFDPQTDDELGTGADETSMQDAPDVQSAPQGYYQHVPLFADVLDLVDGRVPLIVEFKFDDKPWDKRCGELMEKGDELLRAYDGRYVVESFQPQSMGWYKKNRPEVCRGQLAYQADFDRSALRQWAAGRLLGDWVSRPDFIAYDWVNGGSPQVRAARALGATAVAWTVRSQVELGQSEAWFSRYIFESFVPRQ